ncbi:BamA/TamA family outer membrane protein [Shimia sp. R10_1]|uniref:BamA/TamA family outer membrane protein n=1 Tax=Shimia sp. R10_1 TaxID=2821095 RepID=UPI001ADC3A87|nr:BamA/TamA family outer membrane protein [Shimia sp. R10_1]MBO9472362.1 BamA/TamA family outer membrane protein [Shimia sp. R10_1]
MSSSLDSAAKEEVYGFREGSVVVAPIPFKNVLIGTGLVLGAGYLFQTDANSDTSIFGLAAMRSDNGSNAFGIGGSVALADNRWQVSVSAAEADVLYDLFVGQIPVPVRQTGKLIDGELLYGLNPDLRVGGGLRYLETTLGYGSASGGPPLPEAELDLATLRLIAKWDTRNDTLSARDGHLLEADLIYGNVVSAEDRDYFKGSVAFTYHHSISERGTLAAHVVGCSVSDSAPFFSKCSLGGTDNFRGYSPAEFLNNALLSAQVEYRQDVTNRFGVVGFIGAGNAASSFTALGEQDLKYAGGLGVRYQLSEKFNAVISADVSLNDRNEDLLYIYVGQRF